MKNHIQGLDTLRAVAALVVIWGHIEQLKWESLHLDRMEKYVPSGHLGVVLFFVISGYLITTLLIREKTKSGTVSIKKFYARRILRIWPLYYFILFASAIIFSYRPAPITLLYCLTIMPNIAHLSLMGWSVSPQVWSIGVEEQFYIVWPQFIRFIRSGLLYFLISVIIGLTILPHVLLFLIHKSSLAGGDASILVNRFFATAKFNCMAMGGLLAYINFYHPEKLSFTKFKAISYALILLPFSLWVMNVEISYFTDEFFGVLFCLLIAVVTTNSYAIFNNRVTNYLGKISYGLYMYHWIVILCFCKFIYPHFAFGTGFYFNVCLYTFSIVTTIAVSSLSYHYFEDYFLRLKVRFES